MARSFHDVCIIPPVYLNFAAIIVIILLSGLDALFYRQRQALVVAIIVVYRVRQRNFT